jgi:hypothetical protein
MYDWITEADIYRTRRALGEETDRLKRTRLQKRLKALEERWSRLAEGEMSGA